MNVKIRKERQIHKYLNLIISISVYFLCLLCSRFKQGFGWVSTFAGNLKTWCVQIIHLKYNEKQCSFLYENDR